MKEKKIETEEILKINYKLGTNYVVFPSEDGWILVRSGSYRVIMSSKENTNEMLYEFVKEHREYNTLAVVERFGIVANIIILILCVINLFTHSTVLSIFNFGALMILFPILMITTIIGRTNYDTYSKVLDEDIAYYGKVLNDIEKKEKKSTRAKKDKKSSEIQK